MNDRFHTTRWSVVLTAGASDPERARQALATLAHTYWPPLYHFARRRGAEPADAEDLVQGFFARLMERDAFATADPERGRFRGFLALGFQRYMADEHARATAKKRGGGVRTIPLDRSTAESTYTLEPVDPSSTPEQEFERRWALTLLAGVLDRLRTEWTQAGRGGDFEVLAVHLGGQVPMPTHAETAEALDMTVGAVKVAVHRMRKRYRALLREAVAETVQDPADVDDELRHLVLALRG